jgi:hypothetical protein
LSENCICQDLHIHRHLRVVGHCVAADGQRRGCEIALRQHIEMADFDACVGGIRGRGGQHQVQAIGVRGGVQSQAGLRSGVLHPGLPLLPASLPVRGHGAGAACAHRSQLFADDGQAPQPRHHRFGGCELQVEPAAARARQHRHVGIELQAGGGGLQFPAQGVEARHRDVDVAAVGNDLQRIQVHALHGQAPG